MSFLSPWYLLGLLGITIPLAIHLIRRQRAERVVLPTVRFLKRAPKKQVYFQKVQQLLLLAVRISIVALLALAFARPLFTGASSPLAGAVPQSLVILLDTSMSMQYADRFDQGKAAVLRVLASLRQGDEAAVVTFADSPETVQPLTTDLAALQSFVRTVPAPGYRSTHFLSALHLADQVLQSAHYQQKRVVLVSDYQHSALPGLDSAWKLSPDIALETVKVGDAKAQNLAITEVRTMELSAQDQETHLVVGRIKRFGAEPLSRGRLFLMIDGLEVASRVVEFGDGSEVVVEIPVTIDQVGQHRCTLSVAGDLFEPDNTHYFIIRVAPPLRVLCISGRSGVRREDDAYWFRSALAQQVAAPFQVDVIAPRELAPESLASYAVVVLMNVGNLDSAQMNGLKSYVKGGGGLLLAPAERADVAAFNRDYEGLTPVLLQRQNLLSEHSALTITQDQRHHSLVPALQGGEPADFTAVRFHGYWTTEPVAGSEVILRFENGDAALVTTTAGHGRVLFFASSLDPEWNNFPRQVSYLPLLHEAMRYLAGSQDQKSGYQVGEFVPLPIAAGGAARVIAPQGEETLVRNRPAGPAFYRAADTPGFYETRSGKWSGSFAVNVSAQESDLAAIAGDAVRAAMAHAEIQPGAAASGQSSALQAQLEKSQQSWWWIVLLVLLLGIFEMFLANRTYR